MTALVVTLAVASALLLGIVLGAWGALEWMRRLRPGRESDLIAELAAVRGSSSVHAAALWAQKHMTDAASEAMPKS